VVGNNGYKGAAGCEALSDFAQVSGRGFFLGWTHRFTDLQSSSLPAKN